MLLLEKSSMLFNNRVLAIRTLSVLSRHTESRDTALDDDLMRVPDCSGLCDAFAQQSK